jgi:uncharacterized protein (TIGR02145 family)
MNRNILLFLLCSVPLLVQSCQKDDGIFNTDLDYGTVSDIEKNTYRTVKIGDQVWMAENLRTTRYNDGTSLVHDERASDWSSREGAYCWYDNHAATYKSYGALYNWTAVNTGKLCPAGWHVPDITEWEVLKNYLITEGFNYDGSPEGNKIAKSLASTLKWDVSEEAGSPGNVPADNNRSGFSALPAGYRDPTHGWNTFNGIGTSCGWWTSTPYGGGFALHTGLDNHYPSLHTDDPKQLITIIWSYGFSVRCLKNE